MSLNLNERAKIVASVKKHVLKNHINVAGVNYDAWSKLVDERTPALLSAETGEFETGVQQLLSELGSSHTVFYRGSGTQVLPQHSINATLRSVKLGDAEHWMFLDVFDDGPAHVAGIKPGDLVVAVDGMSYAPPSLPPFRTGRTYTLSVSDSRRENTLDLTIHVPARRGTKSTAADCRAQELGTHDASRKCRPSEDSVFSWCLRYAICQDIRCGDKGPQSKGLRSPHHRPAGKHRWQPGVLKACKLYVPWKDPHWAQLDSESPSHRISSAKTPPGSDARR